MLIHDAVILCLIRSYRISEEIFDWNKGCPPYLLWPIFYTQDLIIIIFFKRITTMNIQINKQKNVPEENKGV